MIVGWRFSQRGIAKIAASALEDALIDRGVSRSAFKIVLRSDNGLVFGSKVFANIVSRHGVLQQFITPYTPEQNGMIERFFKTLKEECVWMNRFESYEQASWIIQKWIDHDNGSQMHSALGDLTPTEFHEKLLA